MFLQNNGNRIKCYQNAIKATYDTRKSQCLCGFPGLLSLFVLDTRRALLNAYQLSSICFQPLFSLSYTVSLPFLIFCCQFVANTLSMPLTIVHCLTSVNRYTNCNVLLPSYLIFILIDIRRQQQFLHS